MKKTAMAAVFAGMVSAAVNPASLAGEQAAEGFLGVGTRRVPGIVAEHLGLEKGTGLTVVQVADQSPAASGGITQNDVIVRIDDQVMMFPEQLATLIRNMQPGRKVKVSVLRDQKPMEFEVTVGQRPAGLASHFPEEPVPGNPGVEPDDFRPFLDLPVVPGLDLPGVEKQFEEMRRRMAQAEEEMRRAMEQGAANGGGAQIQVFRLDQGRIQINDDKGSIAVERKNGKSFITAKDPQGNVLYEGPYDTDDDKAQVPADIRERAGRLRIENGGLRIENWKCDPPCDQERAELEGEVKPGDRMD